MSRIRDPVFVVTVPHAACPDRGDVEAWASTGNHACDFSGPPAGRYLRDKLKVRGKAVTELESDIPRTTLDMNRMWSRTSAWRNEVSRAINGGNVACLLDTHSYPRNYRPFGDNSIVFLTEYEHPTAWQRELMDAISGGENGFTCAHMCRPDTTDVIQDAHAKGIPAVLIEFSEGLSTKELSRACDRIVEYLCLPERTSHSTKSSTSERARLCVRDEDESDEMVAQPFPDKTDASSKPKYSEMTLAKGSVVFSFGGTTNMGELDAEEEVAFLTVTAAAQNLVRRVSTGKDDFSFGPYFIADIILPSEVKTASTIRHSGLTIMDPATRDAFSVDKKTKLAICGDWLRSMCLMTPPHFVGVPTAEFATWDEMDSDALPGFSDMARAFSVPPQLPVETAAAEKNITIVSYDRHDDEIMGFLVRQCDTQLIAPSAARAVFAAAAWPVGLRSLNGIDFPPPNTETPGQCMYETMCLLAFDGMVAAPIDDHTRDKRLLAIATIMRINRSTLVLCGMGPLENSENANAAMDAISRLCKRIFLDDAETSPGQLLMVYDEDVRNKEISSRLGLPSARRERHPDFVVALPTTLARGDYVPFKRSDDPFEKVASALLVSRSDAEVSRVLDELSLRKPFVRRREIGTREADESVRDKKTRICSCLFWIPNHNSEMLYERLVKTKNSFDAVAGALAYSGRVSTGLALAEVALRCVAASLKNPNAADVVRLADFVDKEFSDVMPFMQDSICRYHETAELFTQFESINWSPKGAIENLGALRDSVATTSTTAPPEQDYSQNTARALLLAVASLVDEYPGITMDERMDAFVANAIAVQFVREQTWKRTKTEQGGDVKTDGRLSACLASLVEPLVTRCRGPLTSGTIVALHGYAGGTDPRMPCILCNWLAQKNVTPACVSKKVADQLLLPVLLDPHLEWPEGIPALVDQIFEDGVRDLCLCAAAGRWTRAMTWGGLSQDQELAKTFPGMAYGSLFTARESHTVSRSLSTTLDEVVEAEIKMAARNPVLGNPDERILFESVEEYLDRTNESEHTTHSIPRTTEFLIKALRHLISNAKSYNKTVPTIFGGVYRDAWEDPIAANMAKSCGLSPPREWWNRTALMAILSNRMYATLGLCANAGLVRATDFHKMRGGAPMTPAVLCFAGVTPDGQVGTEAIQHLLAGINSRLYADAIAHDGQERSLITKDDAEILFGVSQEDLELYGIKPLREDGVYRRALVSELAILMYRQDGVAKNFSQT